MTTPESLLACGNIYKLLAACFYEPRQDDFLEHDVCGNLARLLEREAPAAAEAAHELSRCLEQANQDRLVIDHAALFIGPFELLVPPYGSVWLEHHRRVMGETTMRVLQLYRQGGLTPDVNEPPDHIAIELEFMCSLCFQEAEALAAGDDEGAARIRELHAAFFNSLLTPWAFSLCRSLEEKAEQPFYRALARCLASFLQTRREACRPAGQLPN